MNIITVIYIFTGLYIFFCISTVLLFNKILKLKEELKFQQQLMYKLNEIESLDELNDTQKNIRNNLLTIFSNGNIQEYKYFDRKYDLEHTKELLYHFAKPIE